jgi:hypothetical protein
MRAATFKVEVAPRVNAKIGRIRNEKANFTSLRMTEARRLGQTGQTWTGLLGFLPEVRYFAIKACEEGEAYRLLAEMETSKIATFPD